MGDEPYLAPLPWIIFAIVDRVNGHGVSWASIAAMIVAITLVVTHRREHNGGAPNVLMRGTVAWFALLGAAGFIWDSPTGWLDNNGRVVSALGFAVIAFASIAATPIAEFYTRPHVRPSRWKSDEFHRFNILVTLYWAVAFTIVAVSHLIATGVDSAAAFTTFNWIIPICVVMVAAYRARVAWDEFDDAMEAFIDHDALRAIAFDWDADERRSTER